MIPEINPNDIIDSLSGCILDIDSAVKINKQESLEDKKIASSLLELKFKLNQLLNVCHEEVSQADLIIVYEISNCVKLELINYLKTIKYSYSFYEQYFAYDFLIRLENGFNSSKELQLILDKYTKNI